jgi:hypothetical protein
LLDEFRGARIQLGIFMSIDFVDAAADLPAVPVEDLHARFFWYRDTPMNWAAPATADPVAVPEGFPGLVNGADTSSTAADWSRPSTM